MSKDLKKIINRAKDKEFNSQLFARLYSTATFASIIRYILKKESKNLELFSWFSDRDKITTFENGIIFTIYLLINLEIENLVNEPLKRIKEIISSPNQTGELKTDVFIRIADYFCGVMAILIGYKEKELEANEIELKYKQFFEKVIKGNDKICSIAFYFDENDSIEGNLFK